MKKFGSLIEVHLDQGKVDKTYPDPGVVKDYFGGRGLNIRYLLEGVGGEVSPLDSENVLVISPGFLTGSEVYSASRLHLGSISPLTGFLGSSNVGGDVGAQIRQQGILSLIVHGKAESPVYLWIHEGELEIRGADDLWGKETSVTREKIKNEVGDSSGVGAIGPAGENLATMACLMFDGGHAAGRTGMGAVMGSKNLKAIAASSGSSPVGNNLVGSDVLNEYLEGIKSAPKYEEWSSYDNTTSVKWVDDLGAGTVKNYRDVQADDVESADGRSFKDLPRTPSSCYRCPVHCKAKLEIDRGPHEGEIAERPGFEPLVALGPKCGNMDALESIHLHNRCNELGLDSVEAGSLIAFAMDLYNRDILTEEDTGGLNLAWGNTDGMNRLLERIARREGWLGEILSRGLKDAAAEIGGEAEKYAYHVKGLAMTAMDPRGFKGTALGYAVGSRGGDFTGVYARPEYSFSPEEALEVFGTPEAADRLEEAGKPELVKRSAEASAIADSLGICKVPILSLVEDYGLTLTANLVSEVFGEEVSTGTLLRNGERILNAERLFNLRRGLTAEDDRLPEKFTAEGIESGPAAGSVLDLEGMLQEFYSLMGWDERGEPKRSKLEELGLGELVDA